MNVAGGSWEPTALPVAPGIYMNFVEAAAAAVSGGERGIVALGLLTYSGSAVAEKFYTIERESEAITLFGSANIGAINFALAGGASQVLVYTIPATPDADDYAAMRDRFDTQEFNVFVAQTYDTTEQVALKTWVAANRDEGKHFILVIGGNGTTDADPTAGNSRSTLNADDYIVNVINGGVVNGVSYSSSEYAPHIAGIIANARINESVTYAATSASDVTKRLTNPQRNAALTAGSLVLTNDGKRVKIEQGITTSGKKIRAIRARQAIITDITATGNESYIGKLSNNADGRATLIAAVTKYLETLADNSVLEAPIVTLDTQNPPSGDKVFLLISYVEIDSMERIFFTINVAGGA
jgi:hypothetical protein